MTKENKTDGIALNSQDRINEIDKEVQNEFITSKDEVYREGLRSLITQENQLFMEADKIRQKLENINKSKDVLRKAFLDGILLSKQDVKDVLGAVV